MAKFQEYYREVAVHEAILRHREAITRELGNEAAEVLMAEAANTPALLNENPRVIISAVSPLAR